MKKLDDIRSEIDEVNNELINLLDKRLELSKEVALYKKKNEIEIFDSIRENAIIEELEKSLENNSNKKYIILHFIDIMNISKKCQKDILDK